MAARHRKSFRTKNIYLIMTFKVLITFVLKFLLIKSWFDRNIRSNFLFAFVVVIVGMDNNYKTKLYAIFSFGMYYKLGTKWYWYYLCNNRFRILWLVNAYRKYQTFLNVILYSNINITANHFTICWLDTGEYFIYLHVYWKSHYTYYMYDTKK